MAERTTPAARATASSRSGSKWRCSAPTSTTRCRHRRPRAAGRARRPQAGAPAGPLRDVRRRLPARPRLQQVRPRRRRRHGSVPPARRHRDLRRPGAPGAALVVALSAGRRQRQLRLARQRPGRGRCATPSAGCSRWRWRCCATSTRTPSTSARTTTAGSRSRSCCRAGSRTCWSTARRDRGRDGHQHPAAQPARGLQRRSSGSSAHPDAQRRGAARGADRADPRSRLSHRRADRRPATGSTTPTAPGAGRRGCAPSWRSRRSRGAPSLVVTELPYQVNPDTLAEKIAELVKDGRVGGISDIARRVAASAPASGSLSCCKP